VGQIVAAGRAAKGWKVKDLSSKCACKPQDIQDIEQNKALAGAKNNALLGKIERHIGFKLRGKGVGEPLSSGKPKKK